MKRTEEECTRELQLKEQKRKELYAKQGRGSQFTSRVLDMPNIWKMKYREKYFNNFSFFVLG